MSSGDNEAYRYKWITLACTFFVCSLTWGLMYTIGLYYINWVEHFDAGKGQVAIIGGLNSGTSSLLGPFFDIICSKIGCRRAGAMGGCLMMLGYVGSSFANSILMLCILYGFVLGTGSGLCYFCASVAVNKYFIKQRSFAEGIATLGSGVGGFLFTLMQQYLITMYGWRGGLLITGGITAHMIVLFQLMYSPEELEQLSRLKDWKKDKEISFEKDCIEHDKHDTAIDYHLDEVNVKDGRIEAKESWIIQCLQLFKNPLFWLICSADFLCWVAIYVPFIHLPERARLLGIDVETIAWISSSISLSMSFGRLMLAALSRVFNMDPFYCYGVANALAGLVTVLNPLFTTKSTLLFYAIFYGLMNLSVPLIRATAAKLLGPDKFSIAYGWIIALNGIGLFIGPALAGLLYDATQSYDYSFYTFGICLMVSGALSVFQNLKALRKHGDPADNKTETI